MRRESRGVVVEVVGEEEVVAVAVAVAVAVVELLVAREQGSGGVVGGG